MTDTTAIRPHVGPFGVLFLLFIALLFFFGTLALAIFFGHWLGFIAWFLVWNVASSAWGK